MNGLIDPMPLEARASAKTPKHKDTPATCRERASADLLRSATMITANQQLTLQRSAATWETRAMLLERVEETARKRGGTAPQSLSA
jgi:hypothetical protein